MSTYDRVAWKEGMFLLPQHFQQAERAYAAEQFVHSRLSRPHGYGLIELEIDPELLADGKVGIKRLRAVLRDGTSIDIPRVDSAPPPRDIDVPTGTAGVPLYLALPIKRDGIAEATSDPNRSDIRWVEADAEVEDAHEPARRRELRVLRKNLRLVAGREPRDHLMCIKLAELSRGEAGGIAVSRAF